MDKTKIIAVAVIAVLAANADAANKVTYRDAQGRIQGSKKQPIAAGMFGKVVTLRLPG